MKKFLLALLLHAFNAWALPNGILVLPESPRQMGLGGAYVALANDAQAGIVNPACLVSMKQMGSDIFATQPSSGGTDHLCLSFSNPGAASGGAVAVGGWAQGMLASDERIFYVPYVATSWSLNPSLGFGLVSRFPYTQTEIDSENSGWESVFDISGRFQINTLQIGAMVERAVGGAGIVDRSIRIGGAWVSNSGISFSYEWRGNETKKRYDFHYESSHWGSEIRIGKYFAFRGGYSRTDQARLSVGSAIGLFNGGWRIETAYDFPASGDGASRWAAGMSYRL